MTQAITLIKKGNQLSEIDIGAVTGWDGFDKLIQFLKNEYSIKIISQKDGPDVRSWLLESNNQKFELRYEHPYGNSLVVVSSQYEDIVYDIGRDLQQRFENF